MRVLVAALLTLQVAQAAAEPASEPARATILPVLWRAPAAPPTAVAAARHALATAVPGREPLDLSPAVAPPPLAAERLHAGVVLYDRLRHADARAALDQAAADAVARGAAGLTRAELSDVYLYRALCAHVRGDATRAWDDFVRAAVVAPGRLLDPARFPPRALAMMRRAADEVAAAPRGSLRVVGPAGARVIVDGAEGGTAPVSIAALPYGQHLVRVEHPGYATWAGVVHLASPAMRLEPPLRRLAPPDDVALATAAGERGATHALLVAVSRDADGLRVEVRLVDRGGRRLFVERTRGGAADAAVTRAVGAVRVPGPRLGVPVGPPPPPPATPWYRRVWVWSVVAAVVAGAAIAIPLAVVESRSATAFGSRLDLGAVRR